jgi:arginase
VTAGLVRVPRAWGADGAAMAAAAGMDIGLGAGETVAEDSLRAQSDAIAERLPERPVVLGGCCCAHVGAAVGLARRHGRIAAVWLDAHGDLNTPETSPSGNLWGMPFRIILDAGNVAVEDAALLGARNLDQPEQQYIDRVGLVVASGQLAEVLDGVSGAYVAFDADVLDPAQIDCFMPEPDGVRLDDALELVRSVAATVPLVGLGLTGLVASDANPERIDRIMRAAGLV